MRLTSLPYTQGHLSVQRKLKFQRPLPLQLNPSQPSPHRSDANPPVTSSPALISVHHVFGFGASWPSSSRLSGASPGAEWLVSEPLVTGDNRRHSSTKWLEYVSKMARLTVIRHSAIPSTIRSLAIG
ncbi:uncharacterized protein CLUP02_09940 [Colletotrichum lupini]|uniref:Uncharacterized protein n=1 Tax=Colletotrichum lupini TaxID=145971 RepID=A0A9Q8WI26_9PEZI|nr:uncharacterized protein CLUP02_09940 [Colletotrichum lupini]UQC84443.1 hypothetical protein CLUP02_09940 [Colletotrichum lupini]